MTLNRSQNTSRPIVFAPEHDEPRLPTEDCLAIPFRDNQRVLVESWAQGLRCWLKQPGSQSIRRYCFQQPWLEPDGLSANGKLLAWLMVLDNMTIKSDKPLNCTISFIDVPTREALLERFEALMLAIPQNVRQLAAEFGDLQYVALESMRHVDGFDAFLAQEQRQGNFSYVTTVWRLLAIETQPFAMRLHWAKVLMTEPRTLVMSRLLDLPCPKRLLTVLSRLEADKISPTIVWQLYDALIDRTMSQALCMCPTLSIEALPELLKTPSWMASPGLFQVLADHLSQDCPLDSIIPPAILNAPVGLRARIQRSFRQATDIDALENCIHHWADRLYDEVEFPTPPCTGIQGLLEPILDGLALRREGREMRNCVAGYAEHVVSGHSYFYRWLGPVRATVQLSCSPEGQWLLHEYLGYRNCRLEDSEKNRIILALASAFQTTGLFIDRCKIAGTPYYDFDQVKDQFCDGQMLWLKPQPDNPHDARAVEVFTEQGLKLGFLPRQQNARAFAWLSRGLPVAARLVQSQGHWRIDVHVVGMPDAVMCDGFANVHPMPVAVPPMKPKPLAMGHMIHGVFGEFAS